MEDAYQRLEMLGKGTYGTVYRCQHRSTGNIVAIKVVQDDDASEQIRKAAIREASLLKQLKHPNVVSLLEVFRTRSKLYLVFEHMERNLLHHLRMFPRGLPASEVNTSMWQLVLALSMLHSQGIIHRDVKPENLLIDPSGTVKLCDLGFARTQEQGDGRLSPYVATRWYRAPELLLGDAYGPGVDIWALGCLMVELATGRPLFPGMSDMDQLWRILQCTGCSNRQLSCLRSNSTFAALHMPQEQELLPVSKRFRHWEPAALSLLSACLAPDPKDRPTAQRLMQHPFFAPARSLLAAHTKVALAAQQAAGSMSTATGHKSRSGSSSGCDDARVERAHSNPSRVSGLGACLSPSLGQLKVPASILQQASAHGICARRSSIVGTARTPSESGPRHALGGSSGQGQGTTASAHNTEDASQVSAWLAALPDLAVGAGPVTVKRASYSQAPGGFNTVLGGVSNSSILSDIPCAEPMRNSLCGVPSRLLPGAHPQPQPMLLPVDMLTPSRLGNASAHQRQGVTPTHSQQNTGSSLHAWALEILSAPGPSTSAPQPPSYATQLGTATSQWSQAHTSNAAA